MPESAFPESEGRGKKYPKKGFHEVTKGTRDFNLYQKFPSIIIVYIERFLSH